MIREAIAARAPLALKYGGDRGTTRTVHPQVPFRTSTGKLCVDCFQVAISSGSFGRTPGLNLAAAKYRHLLAHV